MSDQPVARPLFSTFLEHVALSRRAVRTRSASSANWYPAVRLGRMVVVELSSKVQRLRRRHSPPWGRIRRFAGSGTSSRPADEDASALTHSTPGGSGHTSGLAVPAKVRPGSSGSLGLVLLERINPNVRDPIDHPVANLARRTRRSRSLVDVLRRRASDALSSSVDIWPSFVRAKVKAVNPNGMLDLREHRMVRESRFTTKLQSTLLHGFPVTAICAISAA